MSMGKKAKIAGCGGCGCLFLGIAGFVGGILYLTVFSNTCAKMMGEETYPFKADTKNLDPFAALGEVRQRAGKNARLISIEASYVRSDGTMNLEATYKPAPRISYKFQVPLDKGPKDAPPIGAGRGPNDVWVQDVTVECYEPGQRRHVTRIGGGSRSEYNYINEGMDIDRGSPSMRALAEDLGHPKMSPAALWKIAIEKGASKDAVATINYDKDGYEFYISGTKVRFECDPSGKVKD